VPSGNFIHELEVTVLNGTNLKRVNRVRGGGWQGVRRVLMTEFSSFSINWSVY